MAHNTISVGSSDTYGLKNIFEGISSCRHRMGRTSQKRLSAFGQQLAVWILEAGYASRSDFARTVGMTPSNLSRLMRQKEPPGVEKLAIFAEALKRPIEELNHATQQWVDKVFAPNKIAPSLNTNPTQTEGSPMRERIEQILGALRQVPTGQQQDFIDEVSDIAAEFRLGLRRRAGGRAGKRRASRPTG